MKVFLTNLNVGSAIEYVGDVIMNWAQELPIKFIEYKTQTAESTTYKRLLEESPDIIVVNELYPRIISPVLFYKLTYPQTKIILFIHSQEKLLPSTTDDVHKKNQYTVLMDLVALSEVVYTLNAKKEKINPKEVLKFCPSEPKIFNNHTPWVNRPNLFCIMGSIYPLKIHQDFLKSAKTIPSQIDIYGSLMEKFADKTYCNYFETAIDFNLKMKGQLIQKEVGKVLNQYKYIIFPHHGRESFCMMLQQAIMCGTIPILLNDDSGKDFDPSWADWANGLYYGCTDMKQFIENLIKLSKDEEDLTALSNFISKEITKRFNYDLFKKEFQDLICKKN